MRLSAGRTPLLRTISGHEEILHNLILFVRNKVYTRTCTRVIPFWSALCAIPAAYVPENLFRMFTAALFVNFVLMRAIEQRPGSCTHMAMCIKHKICVFGFCQVVWAVRKSRRLNLVASDLPCECGRLVHQEPSERFACACKVQEVQRVNVCTKLSPSCPSAKLSENKTSAYEKQHVEV